MKDFSEIIGNEALLGKFSSVIREGKLPHAIILEGNIGTGKHKIALSIAAALSCENKDGSIPCTTCKNCRKILGGISPDVIYVKKESDKAQMTVDVIRQLRRDVRLLPNDLEEKVYIIEDAHLMNPQAQNAFLLTLEEPPKYVHFILLCETTTSLLETVRSRAQIFRLELIPDNKIAEYLRNNSKEALALYNTSKSDFDSAVAAADGSIGRALSLLSEKERRPISDTRKLTESFLHCLLSQKGRASVDLVLSFPQKRDELSQQLTSIQTAIRDLLVQKKTDKAPLCFFTDTFVAYELSVKYKASRLMKIYTLLEDAKEKLGRNSNVRLTLFSLASDCGLI